MAASIVWVGAWPVARGRELAEWGTKVQTRGATTGHCPGVKVTDSKQYQLGFDQSTLSMRANCVNVKNELQVIRLTNTLKYLQAVSRLMLSRHNQYELIVDTITVKPKKCYPLHRDVRIKKVKMKHDELRIRIKVKRNDNIVIREDRKSTRLNSSHSQQSRMPSSA